MRNDRACDFIFKKFDIAIPLLTNQIELALSKLPNVTGKEPQFSRGAAEIIQRAAAEARKMQDEFLTIEHLLLGFMESKDAAAQLLKDQGLNLKDLKTIIAEMRKGQKATSSSQEQTFQSLACAYGIARDDGFGLFAVQRFQMRGDGFVDIGFLRAFGCEIARGGDAEINDAGGVRLRERR